MTHKNNMHRLATAITKINPSVLLFLAAIVAIIFANSPFKETYFTILDAPVNVQIGGYGLFMHDGHPMTLAQFVNDALMAIFFFVIGLEIKKEIIIGVLSSFRKALLPIIAAVGGMIVPVLIFLVVCHSEPEMFGAAIPMATDIAFALAVLSTLGSRVPTSLKVFLTALAVVDDIGGILVIAIFYTSQIMWIPLIIALALIVITYFLGQRGLDKAYVYYLIGFVVWTLFLHSGVHTTISGVLLAMAIPAVATVKLPTLFDSMHSFSQKYNPEYLSEDEKRSNFIDHDKLIALRKMEKRFERAIPPVQFIEHDLHPLVNFLVLPLFAFVNSGVTFGGIEMSQLLSIPLAIFLGLFIGKTIGIFSFTWLFTKMKVVSFPKGMTTMNLLGVSIFGGIGFTVSLFIANLSYGTVENGVALLNQAKIGVFLGTIVSGIVGYLVLRMILNKEHATDKIEK